MKREGGETVWKKFITLLMILLVMLLTNVMVFADPSEDDQTSGGKVAPVEECIQITDLEA